MTEKTPASGYELHVKGTGNYDWAAAAGDAIAERFMSTGSGDCSELLSHETYDV